MEYSGRWRLSTDRTMDSRRDERVPLSNNVGEVGQVKPFSFFYCSMWPSTSLDFLTAFTWLVPASNNFGEVGQVRAGDVPFSSLERLLLVLQNVVDRRVSSNVLPNKVTRKARVRHANFLRTKALSRKQGRMKKHSDRNQRKKHSLRTVRLQ